MIDLSIKQLDDFIATASRPSPGPSLVSYQTVLKIAAQLRELLIVTTNSDFTESLIEFLDPTFAPNWGPEYTYGDDADGNRGVKTRDLESVNVEGLPDWVPEVWRQAMQEWAMENKAFYP